MAITGKIPCLLIALIKNHFPNAANWQVYQLKWRAVTYWVLWVTEMKWLYSHGALKAALDSSKLSVPRQLLISQKLTHQRQIKNQQWKTPTADTEFDQMACLECYFVPHKENSYDTTNIKKIKWLRSQFYCNYFWPNFTVRDSIKKKADLLIFNALIALTVCWAPFPVLNNLNSFIMDILWEGYSQYHFRNEEGGGGDVPGFLSGTVKAGAMFS